MFLVLTWVEKYAWIHGQSSLVCLVRYETFSSLNSLGPLCFFFFFCSCSHTVYGYTWIGSRHGISRRPLPKLSHVRWKVQNMSAYCYLFSKSFYGEIHARRCLEALSEAIVRYSLNFMKVVLWKSTSRLPPNSRKTSTRAEDPIITVSKRRWHRHNVRTISATINA